MTRTLTVVHEKGAEWVAVPDAALRVTAPDASTTTVTLGLSPVVVGSGESCTIVCDDAAVSRRHCELRIVQDRVHVRDLGSKNGTWTQGVRIVEASLADRQVVTVGATRIELLASSSVNKLPLSERSRFGDALGASPVMRALFALLERASLSSAPILLLGETGSGKEVLARAIHAQSPRREGPFVVFDCGATPPTLIEAELFGVARGAFSGAERARRGLLETADGGTLFLDELGELPLEMQTRLLRALESGTVKPVGDNTPREIDVRVVAATHRDLKSRVASGRFREDLYYRVAVLIVQVPALRERKEDIPLLVEHFLQRQSPPRSLDELPPNVLAILAAHDWPGNVRELGNTVTRLALFPSMGTGAIERRSPASREGQLGAKYFPLPLREARAALVEEFELAYLKARLHEQGGNVAATARELGISRQFLYRLMDQYGLTESTDA